MTRNGFPGDLQTALMVQAQSTWCSTLKNMKTLQMMYLHQWTNLICAIFNQASLRLCIGTALAFACNAADSFPLNVNLSVHDKNNV